MDTEKLKQYYALFTDCWKLFKKHAGKHVMNENVWNCFLNDAEKLRRKYETLPESMEVIWGTQKAVDGICTERERRGDKDEQNRGRDGAD